MLKKEDPLNSAITTRFPAHFHRVPWSDKRVSCTGKLPVTVTRQLLRERKGVHEVALTECPVCGTVFRFYPHKGSGFTHEWRETGIEIRREK